MAITPLAAAAVIKLFLATCRMTLLPLLPYRAEHAWAHEAHAQEDRTAPEARTQRTPEPPFTPFTG
ncbi:hypothetical protein SMD11_5341 [Streptomyces albireticuli]|uniref:Uncharacterized protein n=1 Tax=Streptomyces albireticuli TaxID=1940 RepID=A0A1Z2L9D3_9ACTN|nr:hypothetical protein SMD11_5341 [Streptomyces albireticuli]